MQLKEADNLFHNALFETRFTKCVFLYVAVVLVFNAIKSTINQLKSVIDDLYIHMILGVVILVSVTF